MQQIKIFKSIESDLGSLEKEANQWLRESGVKVISVTGNIAPQTAASGSGGLTQGGYPPSDIVLIVLYDA